MRQESLLGIVHVPEHSRDTLAMKVNSELNDAKRSRRSGHDKGLYVPFVRSLISRSRQER